MKITAVYQLPDRPDAVYSTDEFPIPGKGVLTPMQFADILEAKINGVIAALLAEVDHRGLPLWRTEEVRWTVLLRDSDFEPPTRERATHVQGVATAISHVFLPHAEVEVLREFR